MFYVMAPVAAMASPERTGRSGELDGAREVRRVRDGLRRGGWCSLARVDCRDIQEIGERMQNGDAVFAADTAPTGRHAPGSTSRRHLESGDLVFGAWGQLILVARQQRDQLISDDAVRLFYPDFVAPQSNFDLRVGHSQMAPAMALVLAETFGLDIGEAARALGGGRTIQANRPAIIQLVVAICDLLAAEAAVARAQGGEMAEVTQVLSSLEAAG